MYDGSHYESENKLVNLNKSFMKYYPETVEIKNSNKMNNQNFQHIIVCLYNPTVDF